MYELNNFSGENEVIKNMTLSQIVTRNFKAAKIFEKYDLDFCCKGNKKLGDACKEKGISTELVFDEINRNSEVVSELDLRFNSWELDFLIDYILNNHHQYIRESIPVIASHSEKVIQAHGKSHPELMSIGRIFSLVYKELKQHLVKEEEILFPYIKYLVRVKQNLTKYEIPYFGKISNPIKMMETEHESAGRGMFEIRQLSGNYSVPADACNTYSVFYQELKEFEEDLHRHVHLENNILFLKAIELEAVLSKA